MAVLLIIRTDAPTFRAEKCATFALFTNLQLWHRITGKMTCMMVDPSKQNEETLLMNDDIVSWSGGSALSSAKRRLR
jgi:hypothetical protein